MLEPCNLNPKSLPNEALFDINYYVLADFSEVDEEVIHHFKKHDADFYPCISSRSSIIDYIRSVFDIDGRLIICSVSSKIVAIMGIGLNHPTWKFYYQYISIDASYRRKGIADTLLEKAIEIFLDHGATRIIARTWSSNKTSQQHFRKHQFIHFDTIMDDRSKGIHSNYFTKVLSPLRLEKPLTFLGLIGGMGTFATGNFIKTLSAIPRYIAKEQHLMPFLVVNDPSIPDRTEYIYQDRVGDVVSKVNESINRADQRQLSHLVILCFTFHPFINQLRVRKEIEIINLIDTCARLMPGSAQRCMLIATKGAYRLNTFGSLAVQIPGDDQQERIHNIILEIKSGACPPHFKNEIIALAKNNACNSIILGCTDLHGMFGFNQQYEDVTIFDPLLELALHLETIRVKNK